MDGSSVASEIPDLLENLYKYPLCSSSEASYSLREDPSCVPFQRYYKLSKKSTTKSNSLVLKETTETSFNKEQSPSTELTYQAYNISDPKGSLRAYLSKSPKPPQKKLKKKPQPTKKIHSTISNQDNSLYLVVSRKESDKVYEIKTSVTGSATLLKIKPDTYSFKSSENVSVKNSLKSNKIIESVKMERKKREEKPKDEENKADKLKIGNRSNLTGAQFGRETTVCHCPFITKSPKKKKIFKPTDGNKSRVRITGRLGLTEDDKYILKCAATIDDQPMETRYAETKGKDSPVNIFFNQHPLCTNTPCNKNTCIDITESQTTDVHTEARTELANKNEATYNICRKGSAATQVNLNLFFSGVNTEQKDETVQCCCGYTKEISTFTEDETLTEAELKNPLVVISVFKKHGGQDQSDFDIKVGEAGDVTIVDNKLRTSEPLQKITPALDNSHYNKDVASNKHTGRISDKNIKARSAALARAASPLRSSAYRSPIFPRNESALPVRSLASAGNERKESVRGSSSPSPRNLKPRPEASTDRNRTFTKGNQTPPRSKFEPNLERKKPSPRPESSPERNKVSNRTDSSPERNKLSNKTESSPERNKVTNKTDSSPERNKLVNRTDTSPERNKPNRGNLQAIPTKTKDLDKKSPYVPFSVRQTLQRAAVAERNRTKLTFEADKNISPRRSAVKQDRPDQVKGTNKEAAKTKKSLVDTFTRKMTEKMASKETAGNLEKLEERTHSGAESSCSRVTVNIDAENDIYDLLFQQDSDTTDLSIRRRRKFRGSPKQSLEHYHENLSASLENFLVSPENNDRKRSVSQTWNNIDNVAYTPPADNSSPPLKFIDSIEVSHRREERSNTINSIKFTQTNFENITEVKEDSLMAPMKHYPGDKCPIVDPMQREMEIRELLGVQKRKFNSMNAGNSKIESISKLSHKDTLHIYCPQQKRKISVMVLLNKKSDIGTMVERSQLLNRDINCVQLKSMATQCECVIDMNRQIKKETFQISEKYMPLKSKSISLTKEDYYKVRKLIQGSLAQKKKYQIYKRASVVLPKEIRRKRKRGKKAIFTEKSTQTLEIKDCPNRTKYKDRTKQKITKGFLRKETANHTNGRPKDKDNENIGKLGTVDTARKESKKTIVLFRAKKANHPKEDERPRKPRIPVQTSSAVEIRYAHVSYKHAAAFTNKDTNRKLTSDVPETKRRPISPNLGFSGLSLCGEAGSVTSIKKPPALRPRKPLLHRLVSCLVLKSQKVTKVKKERSTPKMSTMKGSINWYRVTSSCAPFEMSSSVYDTSVSFYSDHAVEPIPIKSRRGFLSSVWTMLTTRRSNTVLL